MPATINYRTAGVGPPLILIHGWAMHAGVWDGFVREFSPRQQVISVDLRGHGLSSGLPGPYSFALFAADLAGLVSDLGLSRVALAGWSMGVSIILKMLVEPPTWVDALILISGNPSFIQRPGYPHGVPEAAVRRLYRQVARSYPQGLENFYNLLFTPDELAAHPGCTRVIMDAQSAPVQQAALESLLCLKDEDLRHVLAGIRVPTLIIHGSRDRVCLPGAAGSMHARIKESRLLLLEGTGHVPFIGRKDAVVSAIRQFLAGVQTED